MQQPQSRIACEIMDAPVLGTALHSGPDGTTTLRAQLDPFRPTLLLLLRHLGCIFCREMVKDVRIAADRADAGRGEQRYPRVVFVHQGTLEQGARFFGRYWPGATAISDPRRRIYDGLGAQRGSLGQVLGPRACACALRAVMKGHAAGRKVGHWRIMPAALLVSPDGRVLHRHPFRHAGDHPRFDRYANATLMSLSGEADPRSPLPQPA